MGKVKSKTGGSFVPLSEGLKAAEDNQKVVEVKSAMDEMGLPSLDDIKTTEERQAEEQSAEQKQTQKEQMLRDWIATIPAVLAKLASRFWKCCDGDDIHFAAYEAEWREIVARFVKYLGIQSSAIVRQKVVTAYALAMAEAMPAKKWDVISLLNGSIRKERMEFPGLQKLEVVLQIEKPEKATYFMFDVGDRSYWTVAKTDDMKKLVAIIQRKLNDAKEEATDNFQDEVNELMKQSTPGMILEKLLPNESGKGESGKLAFQVPQTAPGARDGGYLLVHSDGNQLSVLGAAGHIKRQALEIQERQRALNVYTLGWDTFRQPHGMDLEIYEDLKFIWGCIKDAARSDEDRVKRFQAKEDFKNSCREDQKNRAAKATVSAEDFLLKNARGKGHIIIPAAWEVAKDNRTERYWFVNFIAERGEDDKVKLLDFPKRLEGLFADPKLTEPTSHDKDYKGLRYPLNAMLAKARGIAARFAKQSDSAGSPETPQSRAGCEESTEAPKASE